MSNPSGYIGETIREGGFYFVKQSDGHYYPAKVRRKCPRAKEKVVVDWIGYSTSDYVLKSKLLPATEELKREYHLRFGSAASKMEALKPKKMDTSDNNNNNNNNKGSTDSDKQQQSDDDEMDINTEEDNNNKEEEYNDEGITTGESDDTSESNSDSDEFNTTNSDEMDIDTNTEAGEEEEEPPATRTRYDSTSTQADQKPTASEDDSTSTLADKDENYIYIGDTYFYYLYGVPHPVVVTREAANDHFYIKYRHTHPKYKGKEFKVKYDKLTKYTIERWNEYMRRKHRKLAKQMKFPINHSFKKEFAEHGMFTGVVASHNKETGCYHVQYEDGDTEELYHHELEDLQGYELKPRKDNGSVTSDSDSEDGSTTSEDDDDDDDEGSIASGDQDEDDDELDVDSDSEERSTTSQDKDEGSTTGECGDEGSTTTEDEDAGSTSQDEDDEKTPASRTRSKSKVTTNRTEGSTATEMDIDPVEEEKTPASGTRSKSKATTNRTEGSTASEMDVDAAEEEATTTRSKPKATSPSTRRSTRSSTRAKKSADADQLNEDDFFDVYNSLDVDPDGMVELLVDMIKMEEEDGGDYTGSEDEESSSEDEEEPTPVTTGGKRKRKRKPRGKQNKKKKEVPADKKKVPANKKTKTKLEWTEDNGKLLKELVGKHGHSFQAFTQTPGK